MNSIITHTPNKLVNRVDALIHQIFDHTYLNPALKFDNSRDNVMIAVYIGFFFFFGEIFSLFNIYNKKM